ncbi:MAG TPA: hypothetical protein VF796_17715 [Humisphaera sp.]
MRSAVLFPVWVLAAAVTLVATVAAIHLLCDASSGGAPRRPPAVATVPSVERPGN